MTPGVRLSLFVTLVTLWKITLLITIFAQLMLYQYFLFQIGNNTPQCIYLILNKNKIIFYTYSEFLTLINRCIIITVTIDWWLNRVMFNFNEYLTNFWIYCPLELDWFDFLHIEILFPMHAELKLSVICVISFTKIRRSR